jgi:vancomycin resistance protein YoaR
MRHRIKPIILFFQILIILSGCLMKEQEKTLDDTPKNAPNSTHNIPALSLTPTPSLSPEPTAVPEDPNLISSYATKLYNKDENRINNIKTATEELNHSVIEPGDVFSINEKLGKRTEEKGYKEAPILQGGKKGKGVGGGICQISSTIYNAALKADMKIIERHRHSEPVPYVPEGKDAAVVYNSKDFRFKNTKDYPVEIIISVSEDEITVKLYKKENKED